MGGHKLKDFTVPAKRGLQSYTCRICKRKFPKDAHLWTCKACDYYICDQCLKSKDGLDELAELHNLDEHTIAEQITEESERKRELTLVIGDLEELLSSPEARRLKEARRRGSLAEAEARKGSPLL